MLFIYTKISLIYTTPSPEEWANKQQIKTTLHCSKVVWRTNSLTLLICFLVSKPNKRRYLYTNHVQ